jgi:hypothetical protein
VLVPYSSPEGLSTGFTPNDIVVLAPPEALIPGSFYLSWNVADVNLDTYPDLVVLQARP